MATSGVRRLDSGLSAFAWVCAAVTLGAVLQLSSGFLVPGAIAGLTLVLAAATLAVLTLAWPAGPGAASVALRVAGAGLVVQIALHLTTPPGSRPFGGDDMVRHDYLMAAAAVIMGASLSKDSWLGRLTVPLLLVTHALLGVWMVQQSPLPRIDAAFWHREALDALASGMSPYSVTIPNLYNSTALYGPGLVQDGRVLVGFPYPPLSLLLSAPGYFLFGDFRYMNVVAMTVAGGLMAYSRPGRLATAAAAIFLFTPRGFFVLEQGWTEALAACMLAATVFTACRAPRWLAYVLGLLIAVKRYFMLVAPLAWLCLPQPVRPKDAWRFFAKAGLVAAAITLPFVMWDPKGFFDSVVMFQVRQPFRGESLSYLAWTATTAGPAWPGWLGFALLPVAMGLAFWRTARTPAGFAGGVALALLVFFAFAKQAFCNYYYLTICSLCCALAASRVDVSARDRAAHARDTPSHPQESSPAADSPGAGPDTSYRD